LMGRPGMFFASIIGMIFYTFTDLLILSYIKTENGKITENSC